MKSKVSATYTKGKMTRGAWAHLPALSSRQLYHPEHDLRSRLEHVAGKTTNSWSGAAAKSFSLTLLLVVTGTITTVSKPSS